MLPEDYVGKRKKRRRRFGRKRPSKRAQKAKALAAAAAAASVASVDRCMSLTRSPERSPRMRTRLARARQGSDVSDDLSVESTQEWPSQVPVRPPSPRFRVPSRGGSLIWNGSGAAVARHQLFQMRSMFPYMDDDVVRFGSPVPCRLVVLLQQLHVDCDSSTLFAACVCVLGFGCCGSPELSVVVVTRAAAAAACSS